MVWADADIFRDDWFISDKWRFSEDSSCPLLTQYPFTRPNANQGCLIWMEQVNEGHFNKPAVSGLLCVFLPSFLAHISLGQCFIQIALKTSYPSMVMTAKSVSFWHKQTHFFLSSAWKIIGFSLHMLFVFNVTIFWGEGVKFTSGFHLKTLSHYLLSMTLAAL